MRRIYQVWFWTFFAVSSAIYFVGAAFLFVVTLPFDKNGRLLHLYSCFWAMTYVYINPGWSFRVEHRDRLPWNGAAVLVSNHQSAGDILVLFGLYRPYKWVSKASMFKAPFLGWNMALNRYVRLRRGSRESIARMMEDCERHLAEGSSIMIFPEGTRSPDGRLQAFKHGAFTLAQRSRQPILPIVIDGSAGALPKHGFVLRGRHAIRIRVLDPIPYRAIDGRPLEDVVREVRALYARTLGEAPPPVMTLASAHGGGEQPLARGSG